MDLLVAIDLLGGKVVRLHHGDYARATVYADDPVQQAVQFYDAGVRWMHIVDLDGARDGRPGHADLIGRVLEAVPDMKIQVGGGIRDERIAQDWLDRGATRIVVGTAAVKDPDFVRGLCSAHPGAVVVAIDARDGMVAMEGWTETSTRRAEDLATEVDGWGVAGLLYTDIDRTGANQGPALAATVSIQKKVKAMVIAAGGIGGLQDLARMRQMGVRAVVCGRVLYAGVFSLEDALMVCSQ